MTLAFPFQLGVQIVEICLATRDRNGGGLWIINLSSKQLSPSLPLLRFNEL